MSRSSGGGESAAHGERAGSSLCRARASHTDRTALETHCLTPTASIAVLEIHIGAFIVGYRELETQVKAMTTNHTTLKTRINELAVAKKAIEAQVQDLTTVKTSLMARVADLVNDRKTLQSRVDVMSSDVDTRIEGLKASKQASNRLTV